MKHLQETITFHYRCKQVKVGIIQIAISQKLLHVKFYLYFSKVLAEEFVNGSSIPTSISMM